MTTEKQQRTWGEWAFVIGVLFAIFLAFFPNLVEEGTSGVILIVLGALVGLWNITSKETTTFLVAAIALMLVGAGGLQAVPVVGDSLANFASNISAFAAPAAFIVALKAIIDIGKS
jgi:hypothetical protein